MFCPEGTWNAPGLMMFNINSLLLFGCLSAYLAFRYFVPSLEQATAYHVHVTTRTLRFGQPQIAEQSWVGIWLAT